MKRTQNEADIRQVLSVIEDYNTALTLLDNYDHQCMKRPQGNKAIYVLNYEECRKLIDQMRFNADSDLFGHEKDDSFKGSIGNIYQSFKTHRSNSLPLFSGQERIPLRRAWQQTNSRLYPGCSYNHDC